MKGNIKRFFKAVKAKEELRVQQEKVNCSTVKTADKIQFVITTKHFRFLSDPWPGRHVCDNPEDTIILDDEDIAYFKNKYKDSLKQELEEEINNLRKQYEL